MNSLIKKTLYFLLFSLFIVANSYAVPVTVTFDSVNKSQAEVRNGGWAGFYNLEVNDEIILGMCDDYATHVNSSSSGWQAQLYTHKDIISGKGRWGSRISNYNVIGYLFMQTFDMGDGSFMADINQAIWNVNYDLPEMTDRAQHLYKEASAMTAYTGWHGYMDILRPAFRNQCPVSQEFLIRKRPNSVPEPATMFLLGTSLVCLAGFGHRKLRR